MTFQLQRNFKVFTTGENVTANLTLRDLRQLLWLTSFILFSFSLLKYQSASGVKHHLNLEIHLVHLKPQFSYLVF